MIKRTDALASCIIAALLAAGAHAQGLSGGTTPDGRPSFTATLSNHAPLAIGMDISQASAALHEPLQYVSGPHGEEIYLALRNQGGSGLLNHHDRLFLQFRAGRLTGWKEDYGKNWMWQ
jgi:hypothetical protein